jgi:hypothetical protein
MGIVYPNKAVASRWDGALQARLRRAPLEAFLRSRSLSLAPAGASQDSDNLTRATVFIVEAGLKLRSIQAEHILGHRRQTAVGLSACLVSLALAQQISQPEAWRVSALVSTTRLLTPWLGPNSAALSSASIAREFQKAFRKEVSPLDWRIMKSTVDAVSSNGSAAMAKLAGNIAARLNTEAVSAHSSLTDLQETANASR